MESSNRNRREQRCRDGSLEGDEAATKKVAATGEAGRLNGMIDPFCGSGGFQQQLTCIFVITLQVLSQPQEGEQKMLPPVNPNLRIISFKYLGRIRNELAKATKAKTHTERGRALDKATKFVEHLYKEAAKKRAFKLQ